MKASLQLNFAEAKEGAWKDPLLLYIAEHLKIITEKDNQDIIKTMETTFTYINHLIDEFMKSNPRYRKPSGFSMCFCRPSCCPHKITIEYLNQSITLKQITNEDHNQNSSNGADTTVQLLRK